MKVRPVVRRKGGRWRRGKGFSKSELKEAEVDSRQAQKLGIPIDPRRKTKHKENVEALKKHLQSLS